jgi:hypothetical protein
MATKGPRARGFKSIECKLLEQRSNGNSNTVNSLVVAPGWLNSVRQEKSVNLSRPESRSQSSKLQPQSQRMLSRAGSAHVIYKRNSEEFPLTKTPLAIVACRKHWLLKDVPWSLPKQLLVRALYQETLIATNTFDLPCDYLHRYSIIVTVWAKF